MNKKSGLALWNIIFVAVIFLSGLPRYCTTADGKIGGDTTSIDGKVGGDTTSIDGKVGGDTASIDWSPFTTQSDVNLTSSKLFIADIPVHQFWDVLKASFRAGVMGEMVKDMLPRMVSRVERRLTLSGKSSLVESYIVETSLLFMHSIGALKYLDTVLSDAQIKLSIASVVPWGEVLVGLVGESANSGKEPAIISRSLPSLRLLKEILNLHSVTTEQVGKNWAAQIQIKSDRFSAYHQRKKFLSKEMHDLLLLEIEEHYSRRNLTTVEKFLRLDHVVRDLAEKRVKVGQSMIYEEFNLSHSILERRSVASEEAFLFRMEQEKLLFKEAEMGLHDLVNAKAFLLQVSMEQGLQTVFTEGARLVSELYSDPIFALQMVALLVGAALCILVLVESAQMLGMVLRRRSRLSRLQQTRRGRDRLASVAVPVLRNALTAEHMLVEELQKLSFPQSIQSLVTSVQQTLKSGTCSGLGLPTILLTGPSGSGKSTICELLETSLANHMKVQNVCGGDLQALGAEAGLFLRELLTTSQRKKRHGEKPTLLFIEEADSIVRARSTSCQQLHGAATGSCGRAASVCLYALLTGLAEHSPCLAVVFTTRLPVSAVDEALRDR